jgi:spore maturation protein SpmB
LTAFKIARDVAVTADLMAQQAMNGENATLATLVESMRTDLYYAEDIHGQARCGWR